MNPLVDTRARDAEAQQILDALHAIERAIGRGRFEGWLPCPKCHGTESLRFRVYTYRHRGQKRMFYAAKCASRGCLEVMEQKRGVTEH